MSMSTQQNEKSASAVRETSGDLSLGAIHETLVSFREEPTLREPDSLEK